MGAESTVEAYTGGRLLTGTGNPQSGSRRPAPGRSRARYGTSRWTNDLAVAARIDLDSPLRIRSVPAVWWPGSDPDADFGTTKMR